MLCRNSSSSRLASVYLFCRNCLLYQAVFRPPISGRLPRFSFTNMSFVHLARVPPRAVLPPAFVAEDFPFASPGKNAKNAIFNDSTNHERSNAWTTTGKMFCSWWFIVRITLNSASNPIVNFTTASYA